MTIRLRLPRRLATVLASSITRVTFAVLTLFVALLPAVGCDVAAPNDEGANAIASPLADAWGPDPCKVLKPTIVGHNHIFIGTEGDDVIFGTDGNDIIYGNGGNDIICAGGGDDVIYGGEGNDYIDGGDGNDVIDAGPGNDIVHGRGGSDVIHGGDGDDILFGDILDDKLYGDAGNDVLIGGHGADLLDGGPGDDWLRGDTNEDQFYGGPGYDVASFETAMPPGQPQGSKNSQNPIDGIEVDFAAQTVSGDGFKEPLVDVEKVIGSPFNDNFLNIGNHEVVGDHGNDMCDGVPCGNGSAVGNEALVYMTTEPRDLGLMVIGTPNDDNIEIRAVNKSIQITETKGRELRTGHGCTYPGTDHSVVVCEIGNEALRYITGWGDKGDDRFEVKGEMPRDITVHIDGGEGDDVIIGGDEQDVFFTGRLGRDQLYGNGGDDALISESYDWMKNMTGAEYAANGGGDDILDGGEGNDQLVVDYPCGGHHFSGGPGHDIAGFARSGSRPLTAQLGGKIVDPETKQPYYGRAFNDLCTNDWQTYGTHIAGDLEVLEGSDGDDILHGDDGDNTIWGRDGNDRIYGHGGDDILRGLGGNDVIYGGKGHDFISGGDGFDWIYAGDGEEDDVINCNDGGGVVMTKDPNDPTPIDCGGTPPPGGPPGGTPSPSGGNSGGSSGGCSGDDFSLPTGAADHCYRVITARTWDQAHDQCEAVNMHLATLTLSESNALAASNHIGTVTWIGGHRDGSTKQFSWVKQDETFPSNPPWFNPTEANDPAGDNCVAFLQNGQWTLRACTDTLQALCEDF